MVQYHISGQLKVAPEHVSDAVLSRMGKPRNAVYNRFVDKYFALNKQYGMNQFLVPYLMSSHPGSTMKEAVELAEYIRDMGYNPEQVQDFYPTPSTLSTVMYYTGLDPRTMEKVYVPTDPHEKAMQRALIQYRDPKNYYLVREALMAAHREDLIGSGPKCLIRAVPPKKGGYSAPPRAPEKKAGPKAPPQKGRKQTIPQKAPKASNSSRPSSGPKGSAGKAKTGPRQNSRRK